MVAQRNANTVRNGSIYNLINGVILTPFYVLRTLYASETELTLTVHIDSIYRVCDRCAFLGQCSKVQSSVASDWKVSPQGGRTR